jgi:hypothetical protein
MMMMKKFFINIFNFLLLQNKRLGTHAGMADRQEIYPPPKERTSS